MPYGVCVSDIELTQDWGVTAEPSACLAWLFRHPTACGRTSPGSSKSTGFKWEGAWFLFAASRVVRRRDEL